MGNMYLSLKSNLFILNLPCVNGQIYQSLALPDSQDKKNSKRLVVNACCPPYMCTLFSHLSKYCTLPMKQIQFLR